MVPPYAVLMIKPLSVGRGNASSILEEILDNCPVTLRKFRDWIPCPNTLVALDGREIANLEAQVIFAGTKRSAWICLFTHVDRMTDPTPVLSEFAQSLRGKYLPKQTSTHPADTVVRISSLDRSSLEASLLFRNFDENTV